MAVRQLAELKKQLPSLYALLSANALALAFTHHGLAPAWLTTAIPASLVFLCGGRAYHWWRFEPASLSEDAAARKLRITTLITIVFSTFFVCWAMELYQYGSSFEQGHVSIFVAITVVACIFCLTHLPAAALCVTAIVMGVFLAYCLTSGNSVLIAVALSVSFVTVVMVRILMQNFLAFIQLIDTQVEGRRLAEENALLAHTDFLTELPNRRYFFQRLDQLIAHSEQEEASFALAIFDLDSFKPINDTYGHNAGDRVLAETAARLAAFAGADVTVSRLGGDEFGVLFRNPGPTEEIVRLCDGICEALQTPVRIGATEVVTGCSGGLALYPAAGRDGDALFDRADYALYHSKERRRGTTTLFSLEHEDAIRAERTVEAALRSADLAAEMELHYQPILDTATNTISMIEGLARWTSPALGAVPPDRFIAAAERSGTIHSVTMLLFRKALADAERLPPHVGLSFNLSSHDLASPETVLAIVAAARDSKLDPSRITLELTETALMRDFARAQDAITALRALGMKIALDDFGTGYSSLGYVHRLALDKIKIDRSFIGDICSDLGRSVIATILDLCHNLGLEGVAEGVETAEQMEVLRRLNCRHIQGYLVGAPVPLEDLLARLERERAAAMKRVSPR